MSRAGKLDVDELWDKHSEGIGDDIDSLQEFAGTQVITRQEFIRAVAEVGKAYNAKVAGLRRLLKEQKKLLLSAAREVVKQDGGVQP